MDHLQDIQVASRDVWRQKCQLPGETCPDDVMRRVAKALAAGEADPQAREAEFLDAMRNGATPAGRILANAGAGERKAGASTINCVVSQAVPDSMEGIGESVKRAGLALSAGCGIGYDFSTLRPSGAHIAGVGASTSGALPFMRIFDSACRTISSAGGRRGAQMGCMDVRHPDVESFIEVKKQPGELTHFNLSVLITDDFLDAVRADGDHDLIFPITRKDAERRGIGRDDDRLAWAHWPKPGPDAEYFVDGEGRLACWRYRTVKAKALWDAIMRTTYDYAEPGFLLIDRINRANNLWFCEDIRATNPCGEQPLPPNGACLLGSVNLARMVDNAFADNASFDWERLERTARTFSRMLDNVVEDSGLPLAEQRDEIARKRRHGMGFLGLGSACAMLGIEYGGDECVRFTERVSLTLAKASWLAAVELAKEKGAAPVMDEVFEVTEAMLSRRPDLAGRINPGDRLRGVELALLGEHFAGLRAAGALDDAWFAEAKAHGLRYSHATSIAPAGTISFASDNASNGVEPTFRHDGGRLVVIPGRKTKAHVRIESAELRAWRAANPGADGIPAHWVGAEDISPLAHVAVQAAAQKHVDSAASKTVNVPEHV